MDPLDAIDPKLCVSCKAARALCGIQPCPLLARVRSHLPKTVLKSKELFGSSPPALFVGRYGYPHVNVGPMLPAQHLEDGAAARLDDPASWMDMSIPDVVGLRSSLVRTMHKVKVQSVQNPDRITNLSQELAIAARPVDAEVHLTKIPSFDATKASEFNAPHGPTATVERASLTENVRVERRMEAATSDTDLRASEALVDLYNAGTSPYQLERVLSAGMVGLGAGRKLVPTRWSITATDDTLGDAIRQDIRDHETIDKPLVFQGGAFGNRFLVLLLPRVWGFDFSEVWMGGSFWARELVAKNDFEDHGGRSSYASNTSGGYYAARLPVLEYLRDRRRQATAIVLREITDEYTTPLGVWVVREACRAAMQSRPLAFEDLPSALRHMDRHALHKEWQQTAQLLHVVKQQRTLDVF